MRPKDRLWNSHRIVGAILIVAITSLSFLSNSPDAAYANGGIEHFAVLMSHNQVHAYDWPLGDDVTLEIDDPSNGAGVDYSTTQPAVEAPWDPSMTWVQFQLNGSFTVMASHVVTVTDGVTPKSHTVTNLLLIGIDPDSDEVTGTADAGVEVAAWIRGLFGTTIATTADSSGNWLIDFTSTYDIVPGSAGHVNQQDEDGDDTRFDWELPNPSLHVVPSHPEIHGHGWRADLEVLLEIDDPSNGVGVDYTDTKSVTDNPWCGEPCFDLKGVFDVQPGFSVTFSNGETVKSVVVTSLQVTSADPVTDTVSGTTDPGTDVLVNIFDPSGASRHVTADGSGSWIADFSVVGDEDFEQDTFDIEPGTSGRAIQHDFDWSDDGTLTYWGVPSPLFQIYLPIALKNSGP